MQLFATLSCERISVIWKLFILTYTFTFTLKLHGYGSATTHLPRCFCLWTCSSTHWGRVTHICVSKLTIIGSDNGLSPGRRQAVIWTNAGILLIAPSGTNFSEILIELHTFPFMKMHLKMSSGNWRPFCLSLNVLNIGLNMCYLRTPVCRD